MFRAPELLFHNNIAKRNSLRIDEKKKMWHRTNSVRFARFPQPI
jgi:hypothetical protein